MDRCSERKRFAGIEVARQWGSQSVKNHYLPLTIYTSGEWEKLSIVLNLLIPKLPAPKEEDLSKGILEAINMDSYRVEKKAAMNIALADADAEIGPGCSSDLVTAWFLQQMESPDTSIADSRSTCNPSRTQINFLTLPLLCQKKIRLKYECGHKRAYESLCTAAKLVIMRKLRPWQD